MLTQIVANSYVLKNFSKINIFTMDLGKNLTGPVSTKTKDGITIKISDEFIKKYRSITGNIIFTYGTIGKLKFYQDNSLKNTEFVAFDGDKIFEIDIENVSTLINDPREYLNDVISSIYGLEDEDEDEKEFNIVSEQKYFSTVPENEELKLPDIKLPYDAYVEASINRLNKMSKL